MSDIIKNIVYQQDLFFSSGLTRNLKFRLDQLNRLYNIIEHNEEKILNALALDLGKSEHEAYTTEIAMVYNEIKHMIKNLPKYYRIKKVRTPSIYWGAKSFIIPEPVGKVLIIGPWNYPFNLMIMPLIGSIAAGNCTILKPSEYAPHTSSIIANIITEAFKPEYIAVIEGDVQISTKILQNPFNHIFFTGGTEVGKIIMQNAAIHLTPITLELGGKSPCIVEADINLEITARRIAWGKYLNAGQTCVAPDYLLVNKAIKNDLLKKLNDVIIEFYGHNPQNSKDYSRIINDRHFDRLVSLLQQGDIYCGGRFNKESLYISPTIIENISSDQPIMQEEIFGPILPVIEYENLEEAIDLIKTKPTPLALYFFSGNKNKQKHVLNSTISGGVCINDTIIHITSSNLPFGGIGQSGLGSYHGRASFDVFTHYKSVMNNTQLYDLKLKYPPYCLKLSTMKRLLKLL